MLHEIIEEKKKVENPILDIVPSQAMARPFSGFSLSSIGGDFRSRPKSARFILDASI